MSVLALEELSAPALDALDRARTLVLVAVSPLEHHGPHLPVGVDYLAARHFAWAIAERVAAARPRWTALVAPPLPLGSFALGSAVGRAGTIAIRQRALRDVVTDWGRALARSGFRHVVVTSGHAGPGHLVALDEAAASVRRRHGIEMVSLSGHLAWAFLQGRLLPHIETALGRALTAEERRAFADDAHAGWWETSLMLLLRPDLVDPGYQALPPARYPLAARLRPDFPLRDGGLGYVGHPALADLEFAKATMAVLLDEAVALVQDLLDGRLRPRQRRSPFALVPFLRTDFWPVAAAGGALLAGAWLAGRRRPARAKGAQTR